MPPLRSLTDSTSRGSSPGASWPTAGPSRYEGLAESHHDHLIDVETGNVIEFVDEELEMLQKRIAEKLGIEA